MGSPGHICRAVPRHLCNQLLVRTVVTGRDEDESLDALAFKGRMVETVEGIYKHVDSLVPPFISSADSYKDGILRHFFSRHGRSHFDKLVPCIGAFLRILFVRFRSEAVLEPVRSDYVDIPLKELLAFLCRNLAHSREHIGILCRLLLERMPCKDIEIPCLCIPVI